jgi:hypothetical protein
MGRLYGRGNCYCWWIIKRSNWLSLLKIKKENTKKHATKRAVLKQGKYLCCRMKIVPREWNSGWWFKITIGTIVGRRSFGKGLVQRNGFRWRFCGGLTVARYYTPTGRSIKPYLKGMKNILMSQKRFDSGELYEKTA